MDITFDQIYILPKNGIFFNVKLLRYDLVDDHAGFSLDGALQAMAALIGVRL